MTQPSDRPRTRIVLVDDHLLFREGIREILESNDDLQVVGEAGDGAATLELVRSARPDVVLLDCEMPGTTVTELVERITEDAPDVRIVVLSMSDDPELVRALIRRNVRGYLHKSVGRHELVAVVRATARSERVTVSVSAESAGRLFAPPGEESPEVAAAPSPLSDRETEVLLLAADALSNIQIAGRLGTTEATVKRHLRNIFGKLGAVSRIDAVNRGIAAGVVPAPSGPRVS